MYLIIRDKCFLCEVISSKESIITSCLLKTHCSVPYCDRLYRLSSAPMGQFQERHVLHRAIVDYPLPPWGSFKNVTYFIEQSVDYPLPQWGSFENLIHFLEQSVFYPLPHWGSLEVYFATSSSRARMNTKYFADYVIN